MLVLVLVLMLILILQIRQPFALLQKN